jgi:hypothetical protein
MVHCGRLVNEAMKVGVTWPMSNELEVVQAFAKRVVQFVGTVFRGTWGALAGLSACGEDLSEGVVGRKRVCAGIV